MSQKYNNINILVVENDYVSYFLIKEMLKPYNFNLCHTLNEQETRNILNSKNRYDLIIIDIKYNDYILYRDIKIQYPNVPIFIQTALEKDESIFDVYDDFIRKPYQIDVFVAKTLKFFSKN